MKINLKYNYKVVCETLVREQFKKFNISFSSPDTGEFEILSELTKEKKVALTQSLNKYGITVLEGQKETLVDRIKNTIDEMLLDDDARHLKVSSYLADKLGYTYSHLSSVFSENTYSSIENYLILRKVDLVKELLQEGNLNLTQIAFKLNYSSVAHLSGQFKKTTGLTPSSFQRIMERKKEVIDLNDQTIKLFNGK